LYLHALATDFDGTLAPDAVVDAVTVEALERFKSTGPPATNSGDGVRAALPQGGVSTAKGI